MLISKISRRIRAAMNWNMWSMLNVNQKSFYPFFHVSLVFVYKVLLYIIELVFVLDMHELYATWHHATNDQSILTACVFSLLWWNTKLYLLTWICMNYMPLDITQPTISQYLLHVSFHYYGEIQNYTFWLNIKVMTHFHILTILRVSLMEQELSGAPKFTPGF